MLPIVRINPPAADALLALDALTLAEVREAVTDPSAEKGDWEMRELSQPVHVRVVLSPVHEIETDNALAVVRGFDAQLNDQLVVVAAHYDSAGRQPDGTLFEGQLITVSKVKLKVIHTPGTPY